MKTTKRFYNWLRKWFDPAYLEPEWVEVDGYKMGKIIEENFETEQRVRCKKCEYDGIDDQLHIADFDICSDCCDGKCGTE